MQDSKFVPIGIFIAQIAKGFTDNSAEVLCRELGFPGGKVLKDKMSGHLPAGSADTHHVKFNCNHRICIEVIAKTLRYAGVEKVASVACVDVVCPLSGKGTIWMAEVACRGSESSFKSCPFPGSQLQILLSCSLTSGL